MKAGIMRRTEYFLSSLLLLIFCFFRYEAVSVLFGVLPVVAVLWTPDARIALLDRIGKFSYSLYLLHSLIGASIVNVLSHKCTMAWQKVLLVITGVACSVLSAYIMYLLVEKPSKRLSSAITYKKKLYA